MKRKVGLKEVTEEVDKKMRMEPEPWPYRDGSAPLTEIWEMGYRDLWDLQQPFQYVAILILMCVFADIVYIGQEK